MKKRLIIFIAGIVGALFLIYITVGVHLMYRTLDISVGVFGRSEGDSTEWWIQRIGNRTEGVDEAIDALSLWGGSGKHIAWDVLRSSQLTNYVSLRLNAVMSDVKEREDRRMGAAWILWRRTEDKHYLVELFKLVQKPGDLNVNLGRRYLMFGAAVEGQETIGKILSPPEQPIPMTVEEFEHELSSTETMSPTPHKD